MYFHPFCSVLMYENDVITSMNVRVKILMSCKNVGESFVVEELQNTPLIGLTPLLLCKNGGVQHCQNIPGTGQT